MGLGGPGRRGAGSSAIVLSESKVWLGPFAKDENDGQPACRLDLPAVLFVVNHNCQCIPSRWRKLAHPRLTRGGEGHRPCRLSWDKKVVVTGFCHSRVPSKGGTEVHCHSGGSFLSVSLMLLLGSCIFTKIPALLDCGYIPTLPLLRCFT